MNVIENAIWQVESNLRRTATLEEIAERCGVTPAYLTRAFALANSVSLMRYARARRLSEAARILALGVPDILGLALDIGYGSHEAFTRAFREHFGVTPETVRDTRSTKNLELTEPLVMDASANLELAAPKIETHGRMFLAGLIRTYPMADIGGIPALWEQFNAMEGALTDVVDGEVAYGASLSYSEERGCEYMAANAVSDLSDVPKDFQTATIPSATYAIFRQPSHITLIRPTIHAIWSKWLPASGYVAAETPVVEFYPAGFDPVTGHGGFEVWLPVRKS